MRFSITRMAVALLLLSSSPLVAADLSSVFNIEVQQHFVKQPDPTFANPTNTKLELVGLWVTKVNPGPAQNAKLKERVVITHVGVTVGGNVVPIPVKEVNELEAVAQGKSSIVLYVNEGPNWANQGDPLTVTLGANSSTQTNSNSDDPDVLFLRDYLGLEVKLDATGRKLIVAALIGPPANASDLANGDRLEKIGGATVNVVPNDEAATRKALVAKIKSLKTARAEVHARDAQLNLKNPRLVFRGVESSSRKLGFAGSYLPWIGFTVTKVLPGSRAESAGMEVNDSQLAFHSSGDKVVRAEDVEKRLQADDAVVKLDVVRDDGTSPSIAISESSSTSLIERISATGDAGWIQKYLGIVVEEKPLRTTPPTTELRVTAVTGNPAQNENIGIGDPIRKVNGDNVTKLAGMRVLIRKGSRQVRLCTEPGGVVNDITLIVPGRESSSRDLGLEGIYIDWLGLTVTRVTPGSPAARATPPLIKGDIIKKIADGGAVEFAPDLEYVIESNIDKKVELVVYRPSLTGNVVPNPVIASSDYIPTDPNDPSVFLKNNLGLAVKNDRRSGKLIVSELIGPPAITSDLAIGDPISTVNENSVYRPMDVMDQVKQGTRNVLLRAQLGGISGVPKFITLQVRGIESRSERVGFEGVYIDWLNGGAGGLVVTNVVKSSLADVAGLRPGFVVKEISTPPVLRTVTRVEAFHAHLDLTNRIEFKAKDLTGTTQDLGIFESPPERNVDLGIEYQRKLAAGNEIWLIRQVFDRSIASLLHLEPGSEIKLLGPHNGVIVPDAWAGLHPPSVPLDDPIRMKLSNGIDRGYSAKLRMAVEVVGTGQLKIITIESGSPAEKAGLRLGDVITDITAGGVTKAVHFGTLAAININRGGTVRLRIRRGLPPTTLTVTLDLPGTPVLSASNVFLRDNLGFTTGWDADANPVITALTGQPAVTSTLSVGDVILRVNRNPVNATSNIESAIKRGLQVVEVEVRSGGVSGPRTVAKLAVPGLPSESQRLGFDAVYIDWIGSTGGLAITDVTSNSPADVAGLKPGNVIQKLSGRPDQLRRADDLHTDLDASPSRTIEVDGLVAVGGNSIAQNAYTFTISESPPRTNPQLGVEYVSKVLPYPPNSTPSDGVWLVRQVFPRSVASLLRLDPGSEILKLGAPNSLEPPARWRSTQLEDPFGVRYQRDGQAPVYREYSATLGMAVEISPSTPSTVRIVAIEEGEPASEAGLRLGEFITQVEGLPLTDLDDILANSGSVKLTVLRGVSREATIKLPTSGIVPSAPEDLFLQQNLGLIAVTQDSKLVVNGITGLPAQASRLSEGDVILRVNKALVASTSAMVDKIKDGLRTVQLEVREGGPAGPRSIVTLEVPGVRHESARLGFEAVYIDWLDRDAGGLAITEVEQHSVAQAVGLKSGHVIQTIMGTPDTKIIRADDLHYALGNSGSNTIKVEGLVSQGIGDPNTRTTFTISEAPSKTNTLLGIEYVVQTLPHPGNPPNPVWIVRDVYTPSPAALMRIEPGQVIEKLMDGPYSTPEYPETWASPSNSLSDPVKLWVNSDGGSATREVEYSAHLGIATEKDLSSRGLKIIGMDSGSSSQLAGLQLGELLHKRWNTATTTWQNTNDLDDLKNMVTTADEHVQVQVRRPGGTLSPAIRISLEPRLANVTITNNHDHQVTVWNTTVPGSANAVRITRINGKLNGRYRSRLPHKTTIQVPIGNKITVQNSYIPSTPNSLTVTANVHSLAFP